MSGDGDFVDLVNFLKARGVRVEVYSFPYSTAEELRHSATEYFQMGTEMVINPQPRVQNGYGYRPYHGEDSNGNGNGHSHHENGHDLDAVRMGDNRLGEGHIENARTNEQPVIS